MKLSLRKANALQAAINEVIAALDLSTDIKINEFENPAEKLALASGRMTANLGRRSGLMDALYEIRGSVSAANHVSGINTMLGDVARLEKDIVFYTRLAKLEPSMSQEVIVGKLGKIKGRTEDYYGREDLVMTNIFNADELVTFKEKLAALKKQKLAVQDKLLELNVRTDIELSESSVELLKTEGLL